VPPIKYQPAWLRCGNGSLYDPAPKVEPDWRTILFL
jgi:hypothetical protein